MNTAQKGFFNSKFCRFFYRFGLGILEAIGSFATDSRLPEESI